MPMSRRCLANTLLYFTRRFSVCCRSRSSKLEFSHMKLAKSSLRCWSSAVESSFSSSRSLVIPSYIRFSMRFSFDGSSHVSGVGYHRRSVSVLGSWNSWSNTLLASSGYLVINVNCSFDIGCRFFAWFGVKILKAATVVFGLRVIV